MHNPLPTCGASAPATPRRTRSRACAHALLVCALFRSPMAAAEFTPGLGLSADAIPQASVLWDCNPDGCFTNGCAGSAELWTKDSDVFWWDDLDEYEAWTNSCDRDYDYDQTNPDNLVTSACSWLSDCYEPGDSGCGQKCIFNVFQDFNNDAAATPGQQTPAGSLISRNAEMVQANGCALLAGLIGTCDSSPSLLGLSPADRSALDAANITLVADMACPSESDVNCAMDLLNDIRDRYADIGRPFNTPADRDIWPFAYIVNNDDTAAVGSTFHFIGGAEEAKRYLKQNCHSGVLSANYLTYFQFSGLRIEREIMDRDYALTDPGSAAVVCRDNARLLENQLKRSIVRQQDRERLAVIRGGVRNGECLNDNELVHLDQDIRSTEGFIASSMFGVGSGPAQGSKHCQQDLLNAMRSLHENCGELKTRDACMMHRIPELQTKIASLRNTMITGVAGNDVSQQCLEAEEEPAEYVTCPGGSGPNGPAATAVPPPAPTTPANPAADSEPAGLVSEVAETPSAAAPAAALGPWAAAAAVVAGAVLAA